MEYKMVEFEGKTFKFPIGTRDTKPRLRRFARLIWVHCGICGNEESFDPQRDLMLPKICADCNNNHAKERERLGLGGGKTRMSCVTCGRTIVRATQTKGAKCNSCKKQGTPENTQLNPELRRRRFGAAVKILSRQHPFTEYAKALTAISKTMYEPRWWDSATEMVVAAELIRLKHAILTQKKVAGHCCDFYLPDLNLLVEVDGDHYHTSLEAKDRDRKWDARVIFEGYRVTRIRAEDAYVDVRKAVDKALGNPRDIAFYGAERQMEFMKTIPHIMADTCMETLLSRMKAYERKTRKRDRPADAEAPHE